MDESDAGPHIGLKRLTAYRRGTLSPAERETVQEHLSLCVRCTGLWRELKEFEAASAVATGDAGPESLRQEAWEALARRLSPQTSAVRPVSPAAASSAGRETPQPARFPPFVYAIAAALLLAVVALSVGSALTVQQDRRRLARLERRLEEREEELAAARRSLADAERRLDAVRGQAGGRVDELETRVAELTSALEKLRRNARAPEARDRLAAVSPGIELSAAPRFALRGQTEGEFLRGDGAVNPVRISSPADGFTVALSLADHPAYGEYRLELVDRNGKTLWAGRRPGRSLQGDAGTSVSIHGLSPGLYRLRIAGLRAEHGEPLAEYLLEVQATP